MFSYPAVHLDEHLALALLLGIYEAAEAFRRHADAHHFEEAPKPEGLPRQPAVIKSLSPPLQTRAET